MFNRWAYILFFLVKLDKEELLQQLRFEVIVFQVLLFCSNKQHLITQLRSLQF